MNDNNDNIDLNQNTTPVAPSAITEEPTQQIVQHPESSKGMRRLGILFIIELSLLAVTVILGYALAIVNSNSRGGDFSGILLIPFVFVLTILALVMTVLCVLVIRARGTIRGFSWWFYIATVLNGAFALLVLWRMVYSAVL